MAIRETFSKCFNFNRPHCVWPVCVFFFLHLIHFGGFSIVCSVGLLIGTIFFRIIFNAIVMSYNENVLIFSWGRALCHSAASEFNLDISFVCVG